MGLEIHTRKKKSSNYEKQDFYGQWGPTYTYNSPRQLVCYIYDSNLFENMYVLVHSHIKTNIYGWAKLIYIHENED